MGYLTRSLNLPHVLSTLLPSGLEVYSNRSHSQKVRVCGTFVTGPDGLKEDLCRGLGRTTYLVTKSRVGGHEFPWILTDERN